MKVLINAYVCGPNMGSEPGMAWNWIVGIAKYHEVFVITDNEWETEINKELQQLSATSRIHFFYNPESERVREMCRNQGDYRFYYFYRLWQKKTLRIAQEIISQHKIDLIHHLNMICFREPGYLWKIKDIPYVWGPIGGVNTVPLQYLSDVSVGQRLKYLFKNYANKLQFRYQPRVIKALRHADALIAANGEAYHCLKNHFREKKVFLINEAGCVISKNLAVRHKAEGFTILWVGRILPTKLLGLSLEIISKVKDIPQLQFHIVGQASSDSVYNQYKAKSEELGIDEICKWHGWVAHQDVQQLMKTSDLLLFTSISEGTPHVVLEALVNGLPVVCFNLCGQGDIISDKTGYKIDVSEPSDSIEKFAKIIQGLYADRSKLKELSDNCIEASMELSWGMRVKKMLEVYEEVMD